MANFSTFHDDDLVRFLQSGEYDAFTEIYNRYWEKMVSYAIKLTKSEEEGADIVQEIFISLWNRRYTIDIKGNLASYLIKGTRNLSLKFIQKNITKNDFLERFSTRADFIYLDIEQNISAKELQNSVDAAVSKLPSKMKEIYLLSRNDQLSHREIAQQLNIAQTTVKKQINNALKFIHKSIYIQIVVCIYDFSKYFLRK
ncbi:RNA polymerase sigma factor [Pedobacter sp. AW1-32]|uniref:RNA polymerase sigma factor n=1 Tax=Pedobacter sp. AW1-32 TaxID=3383026 RepID=UPI003FEF5FA6